MPRTVRRAVQLAFALLLAGAAAPVAASDVIDVTARALRETVAVGGVAELGSGVTNASDTTLSVLLDTYVVYANGLRQQVFPPTLYTLAPGESVVQVAFVLVPREAGPGTAILRADGRATRVEGDPPPAADRFDSDTDAFEVVPAP